MRPSGVHSSRNRSSRGRLPVRVTDAKNAVFRNQKLVSQSLVFGQLLDKIVFHGSRPKIVIKKGRGQWSQCSKPEIATDG